LAGVTVPSFLNAGLSAGILSICAFSGCSSLSTTTSPLRPDTVTGTTSQVKSPLLIAACARVVEAIANSSCASRVKLKWPAQSSAKVPIRRPLFSFE